MRKMQDTQAEMEDALIELKVYTCSMLANLYIQVQSSPLCGPTMICVASTALMQSRLVCRRRRDATCVLCRGRPMRARRQLSRHRRRQQGSLTGCAGGMGMLRRWRPPETRHFDAPGQQAELCGGCILRHACHALYYGHQR